MLREPTRLEPYEIVRIDTGEHLTPPFMSRNPYSGVQAVLQSGLKKDGTPSMANYNGRLSVYDDSPEGKEIGTNYNRVRLGEWARYEPDREALAEPIRLEIARLKAAIFEEQSRLLAVYEMSRGSVEELVKS